MRCCTTFAATQSRNFAPVAGPVMSGAFPSAVAARFMLNQISTLTPSSATSTSLSSHWPQLAVRGDAVGVSHASVSRE